MALTRKFLINSDSATPQPIGQAWAPAPVVGTFLSGQPHTMGYPTLTCTWEKITRANMLKLKSFYSPTSSAVTITISDPDTNTDKTYNAMMGPVSYGNVIYAAYENVSVTFTHLVPA